MLSRSTPSAVARLHRVAAVPLHAASASRTMATPSAAAGPPADPRTGKAPRLPLLQREDCTPEQAEIFDRVTSSA